MTIKPTDRFSPTALGGEVEASYKELPDNVTALFTMGR